MAPTLNSEYRKMLSTPAPLTRPREDKIASLQKQIDFHTAEAHRLRSVQNSHVAISQLPAELLSNVFLYIVETGLRKGHKRFAVGTFTFLRVCRRWNEVAVESPQLWVWWIPGTLKAWNQFKSRSKDAPLFLTWRTCLPKSALNILTGTETPRRIRQLDIDGTRKQLGRILGALDSKSTSTTSSIRLQCDHNKKNNGEHLTRFFSLPFPKLSKLDIDTFPPDPTSSILTTSNLTSLKLNLTYNDNCRYTQSQFLQVFQQHPNLKQLDLKIGGLSLAKNSRAPAPIVLPRLVDLKLCGTDEGIDGFIDLISMSSPLHSVIIDFQHDHTPSVENTTKKFLMVYYGCQGPEHPRKAAWLTVSSSYQFQDGLIIRAESRSTPASRSLYNLQLKFHGMEGALAQRVIPLFPLEHVHGYVIERSNILTNDWCMMLRRMNDLWLLRLDSVDIEPVLNALDLSDEVRMDRLVAPKLVALLIRNANIHYKLHNKLLDILKERRTRGVSLGALSIWWCRVPALECKNDLEDLVKGKVTWENVIEMDSDHDTETEEMGSEDETEAEEGVDSEDEY